VAVSAAGSANGLRRLRLESHARHSESGVWRTTDVPIARAKRGAYGYKPPLGISATTLRRIHPRPNVRSRDHPCFCRLDPPRRSGDPLSGGSRPGIR
jgi:hypothetical protein